MSGLTADQRARACAGRLRPEPPAARGRGGSKPIAFRRATGGEEWDRLVAANAGSTAFHHWRWLQSISRACGWHFLPLIVLDDGEPVGVFPVLLKSRVVRISADVPFPYLGPLVPEAVLPGVLRAFRREQLRRVLPRVIVSFSPRSAQSARRALREARYVWATDTTYVVDVRGRTPEQIEAGCRGDRKRALKRARRDGVSIRPSTREELPALTAALLTEPFLRRGLRNPYPPGIGQVARDLVDGGDAVADTAVVDDTVVGGAVALMDKGTMFNWSDGSLETDHQSKAITAMHTHMIERAASEGFEEYDLVGHVNAGVATFKLSFGAEAREYVSGSSILLPAALVRRLAARRRDHA